MFWIILKIDEQIVCLLKIVNVPLDFIGNNYISFVESDYWPD
jgi:hypothetical protein